MTKLVMQECARGMCRPFAKSVDDPTTCQCAAVACGKRPAITQNEEKLQRLANEHGVDFLNVALENIERRKVAA